MAGEYPSCSCHQQNRPADRGAETHVTGGVHSPAENTRAGESVLQNTAEAVTNKLSTITYRDFEMHFVCEREVMSCFFLCRSYTELNVYFRKCLYIFFFYYFIILYHIIYHQYWGQ